MQYFKVKAGATSKDIPVAVYDSSSTVGAKLAGLVYNTASLTAYYSRQGAAGAATQISLVTKTKGTWVSSGFVAVDGTNMPGDYELGLPDAAIATGATWVKVQLKGAANMVPVDILIELIGIDENDTVRAGLTALPNAAAEASGGLYTRGTGAGQINQPANGQIDANAVKLGGTTQTGRDIGASVLLSSGAGTGQLDFTSGIVKSNLSQMLGTALTETAGQIAAAFKQFFNVATPTGTVNSLPNALPGATGGVFIAGSNAATSVSTALTANITGDLSGSVGSVTADVGITQAGADKVWSSAARTLTSFGTLVADIATAVWAAGTRTLTSFGTLAVDCADALLGRNVSGGSSTGRTVKQALHVLRNKFTVAGSTLTVYDTDDTTPSWTSSVSSSPTADPITGSDPV